MNSLKCFFGVSSKKFLGVYRTEECHSSWSFQNESHFGHEKPSKSKRAKRIGREISLYSKVYLKSVGKIHAIFQACEEMSHLRTGWRVQNGVSEHKRVPDHSTCLNSTGPRKGTHPINTSHGSLTCAILAWHTDKGYEAAIYYLSKVLIEVEHYMIAHKIQLISWINSLRILMTKASFLNLRLVKWAILLSQYDIDYVP